MAKSNRSPLRLEIHLLDSELLVERCASKKLRRTTRPNGPYCGNFCAVRSFIFLHLRRQWLGQAQLAARDHVNAHRIAQSGNFQFQGRVQRSRIGLSGLHVLELKTQIDAAEMLVDVQYEECGNHTA